MAKLRMAHASTHGARKPPGPIFTYKPLPNNFDLLQYSPRDLRTAETIWANGQWSVVSNMLYMCK